MTQPALIITWFVILFGCVQATRADDSLSIDNLQAVVQTLNFLESLPKAGTIAVGVIYSSDLATTQALATETAKAMSNMRGPDSRVIQTVVLSTGDLGRFEGHLDVIFLVLGASRHAEVILDAMHRLHLVSISDDPNCIDANCCVLSVRTAQRVEITLNSPLADAVGARFSLVFMMVVKRK